MTHLLRVLCLLAVALCAVHAAVPFNENKLHLVSDVSVQVYLRAVSGQSVPGVELNYRGETVPDELLSIRDGQLILPSRSQLNSFESANGAGVSRGSLWTVCLLLVGLFYCRRSWVAMCALIGLFAIVAPVTWAADRGDYVIIVNSPVGWKWDSVELKGQERVVLTDVEIDSLIIDSCDEGATSVDMRNVQLFDRVDVCVTSQLDLNGQLSSTILARMTAAQMNVRIQNLYRGRITLADNLPEVSLQGGNYCTRGSDLVCGNADGEIQLEALQALLSLPNIG